MNRFNPLIDKRKQYLVDKQKCISQCKLQKKKVNFWEMPKSLSSLPEECQPVKDKTEFTVQKNGFFGWIKTIFKR